MLAVSPPLRSTNCKDERDDYQADQDQNNNDSFSIAGEEFSCGSLLESIDFDDIFMGIGDGDVLPDLEMDSSDLLAEFSVSGGEESELINASVAEQENGTIIKRVVEEEEEEKEDGDQRGCSANSSNNSNVLNSSTSTTSTTSQLGDQEIVSNKRDDRHDESVVDKITSNAVAKEEGHDHNCKARKSANQTKGSQGKRKVKVDWTPELHRRFVQAVDQLGMDKAVPSRILELMGIDCLTRHNIASHLQKYRSHQKHLRGREAEAASWNQRRQMYGSAGTTKRDHNMIMSPWLNAPTMGFPPPTSLQPTAFRPLLHVWGHPTTIDHHYHCHQPLMPLKYLPHHSSSSSSPQPPRPPWAPPSSLLPQPPDPSYWHLHHQRVPNTLAPGTPYFPQTLATTRFPVLPVPGIPPHAMYKVEQSIGVPTGQTDFHSLFDFHPSTESIDAAIGDVLSKPWLPLPLGLKPPSLDSVMVELQRQGIPKIPPTAA